MEAIAKWQSTGSCFSRPILSPPAARMMQTRSLELRRKAYALEKAAFLTKDVILSLSFNGKSRELLGLAMAADELAATGLDDGFVLLVCPGCGQRTSLKGAAVLDDGTRVCGECKAMAELQG